MVWSGPDGCFCCYPGHQCLWRSGSVDPTAIHAVHRTLVPQYDQIPSIIAVCSHDDRSCPGSSPGCRWMDCATAASGGDSWQSADVLLLVALPAHSSDCGCRVLCALWPSALDV